MCAPFVRHSTHINRVISISEKEDYWPFVPHASIPKSMASIISTLTLSFNLSVSSQCDMSSWVNKRIISCVISFMLLFNYRCLLGVEYSEIVPFGGRLAVWTFFVDCRFSFRYLALGKTTYASEQNVRFNRHSLD